MKKAIKLTALFCTVILFFCACDKSNGKASSKEKTTGTALVGELTDVSKLCSDNGFLACAKLTKSGAVFCCFTDKENTAYFYNYNTQNGELRQGDKIKNKQEFFLSSVTGNKAVFLSGVTNYLIVDMDTLEMKNATVPETSSQPFFTSDGARVYYTASNGEKGSNEILTADISGTNRRVAVKSELDEVTLSGGIFGRYLIYNEFDVSVQAIRQRVYDTVLESVLDNTEPDISCSFFDRGDMAVSYDYINERMNIYFDGNIYVPHVFPLLSGAEHHCAVGRSGIVLANDLDSSLTLYSLDDLASVCRVSIPKGFYASDDNLISPNGDFTLIFGTLSENFSESESMTESRAYIWCFEKSEKYTKKRLLGAFGTDPEKNSEYDVRKLETELERKYSVNIFSGNDAWGYFSNYAVSACTDYTEQYKALKDLSECLLHYPEGFFSQINYDGVSGLYIYIVDSIRSSGWVLQSTGAFSTTDDGKEIMVLKAVNVTEDFPHEMSHVIDHIISAKYRGDYDIEWDALNPDGFQYYYSYLDSDGNDYSSQTPGANEYTVGTDKVYFIDYYSKTYPTEDRARIMEYLSRSVYLADEFEKNEFDYFDGEYMQKKEKLMSKVIRECFNTSGWKNVFWESRLKGD